MSPDRTRGKWRRGWDSNPRYGFPHARFRGECFQPLSHLSAVGLSRLTDDSAQQQRRSVRVLVNARNLAAGCEKLLQDIRALFGKNTRSNFHLVIELCMRKYRKTRS